MVKCQYCDNVYYDDESNCPSCGASLPRAEKKLNDNQSLKLSIGNIDTRKIKIVPRKKSLKLKVVFGIALVLSSITVFNFWSYMLSESEYEGTTSPQYSFTDEDLFAITFDYELSDFDEFDAIYQSNPADKEAVPYLVWYYLEKNKPAFAYEVTDNFLAQKVKGNEDVYITLSDIYVSNALYSSAMYVLEEGYKITNLSKVNEHLSNIDFAYYYEDTEIGNVLELMFGKDLSLITYKDLASIKYINISDYGATVKFSSLEPEIIDGVYTETDEYLASIREINLVSGLRDEDDFDVFPELKVLIIDSSNPVEISLLGYCKNLEFLSLYLYDELGEVPYLANLRGLELSGSGLVDMEGVQSLKNLEYFALENTELASLSNIGGLENLKVLKLEDNDNMTSISESLTNLNLKVLIIDDLPLAVIGDNVNLSGLEKLVINDTGVRNVDFISKCTNLKQLKVSDNSDLISIPSLGGLTQLQELDIQGIDDSNNYGNINFIKGIPNLKSLTIRGSRPKLDVLSEFTSLEELNIYTYTLPNDISVIGRLTNLKKLTITGRAMSETMNISFVSNLKNLEELHIPGDAYVKGEAIFNLPNLKVLSLKKFVGDFSGISKLTNLEELYLFDCYITGWVDVQSQGFITYIDTGDEQPLSKYFGQIQQLKKLRVLDISKTETDSIDFARNLTELSELYISDNYVTTLEPLANHTKLTKIDVTKNPISTWAGLNEKSNIEIITE